MKNQLVIRQLDKQLREWQNLTYKSTRPRSGWVKTLRKALGMTAQQLADRLGLTRSRIVQLEDAEKNDAITLKTLKKVAGALDCELVYVIVPKISPEGNTLEDILKNKADELAEMTVARVSHSMALEDQSINKHKQKKQKEELTKHLLEGSLKKLWRSK